MMVTEIAKGLSKADQIIGFLRVSSYVTGTEIEVNAGQHV